MHDLLRGEALKLLPAEHDPPGGDRHQAGDGVQEARLAGAVRAEQGDDLALLDVKRDLAHRHDRAVADDEALDLEIPLVAYPALARCSWA